MFTVAIKVIEHVPHLPLARFLTRLWNQRQEDFDLEAMELAQRTHKLGFTFQFLTATSPATWPPPLMESGLDRAFVILTQLAYSAGYSSQVLVVKAPSLALGFFQKIVTTTNQALQECADLDQLAMKFVQACLAYEAQVAPLLAGK